MRHIPYMRGGKEMHREHVEESKILNKKAAAFVKSYIDFVKKVRRTLFIDAD